MCKDVYSIKCTPECYVFVCLFKVWVMHEGPLERNKWFPLCPGHICGRHYGQESWCDQQEVVSSYTLLLLAPPQWLPFVWCQSGPKGLCCLSSLAAEWNLPSPMHNEQLPSPSWWQIWLTLCRPNKPPDLSHATWMNSWIDAPHWTCSGTQFPRCQL